MKRTERLKDDLTGIARAAAILKAGGLVALPTETVYGLAADALNPEAVAGIYTAKGRPSFNPLIIHVSSPSMAGRFAEIEAARPLINAFWPGPLTLVLPLRAKSGIAPAVTAGHDSIAVRMPAHPVMQSVLAAFNGPVAAPSANPSGRISPTTAAHVETDMDGKIDAILDGGACDVGVESTIISLLDRPRLLRPGGVPVQAIEALTGPLARFSGGSTAPKAPGMLASHYAPVLPVRLNAQKAEDGEAWLGFGPDQPDAPVTINLSEEEDLEEAATNLFAALHEIDAAARAAGLTQIAVAPIPEDGLGLAINDRLRRAAAPRG
ncbi:L-threonylcarbamoyladenylate synthase [Paracoccaceae bacterium GXU_MW_L88]